MTKNRIVYRIQKNKRNFKSENGGILSFKEFKALINYERTRSDRSGSFFSVITFDEINKNTKSLLTQMNIISSSMRSIDRIGLYEEDQIAVLLPDTAKHGAEIYTKKSIQELESIQEGPISFHIYTYPEDWLSDSSKISKSESANNKEKDFTQSIEQLFTKHVPLWKRSLDIIGSIFGLIICFPILLLTGIFIKLVSPGPVFFNQKRVGYRGQEFNFWKFRTMKVNNNVSSHSNYYKELINSNKPMKKLDDKKDPRIIFGGKIIRKSCIDELPQLWNILKGEMSLVGPRPCIPYEVEAYLRWHTHRFDTIPGLTGLWQVSGKDKLSFREMISLDIIYSQNLSLFLDLEIILITIPAIIMMILEAVFRKINIEEKVDERLENVSS